MVKRQCEFIVLYNEIGCFTVTAKLITISLMIQFNVLYIKMFYEKCAFRMRSRPMLKKDVQPAAVYTVHILHFSQSHIM